MENCGFSEKSYRIVKLKRKMIKITAFFLAFIILVFVFLDMRVRPIAKALSASCAKYTAVAIIYDIVNEQMEAEGIQYGDIITFEKNDEGQISAVKTDVVTVNKFCSALALKLSDSVQRINNMQVSVPLGNIFGMRLLSGRGPKLKFRILPNGAAEARIENVFEAAGINQVHHQIYIKVEMELTSILATYSTGVKVETKVLIAESIIVGVVPGNLWTMPTN